MKNSDLFYEVALKFQNERKAINDEYAATMKGLEDYKGSKHYEEEVAKAKEKRDNALKPLQSNTMSTLKSIMNSMHDVNSKRGVTAPTEEQVRILSVLKMRDNISREELDRFARSMKDNEICLSAINDIASKAGVVGYNSFKYFQSDEMPVDQATRLINSMNSNLEDFIMYDSARAARANAEYLYAQHGIPYDMNNLTKRGLFNSKSECFRDLTGMNGDFETFYDVVDE